MSFLKVKKQQARVFDEGGTAFYSEIAEVLSVVPQGTVFKSTLFNIYIKDTPKSVTNKLSLYADNSKFIGPIDTQHGIVSIISDWDYFCK